MSFQTVFSRTRDYPVSYAVAANEDRCTPRNQIEIPSILRPTNEAGFGVDIIDISIAGFACRAVSGMRPGTRCWLTLPGLAGLQSRVVWNSGSIIGCSFENLLSQPVLDNIIARHQRALIRS